MPRSLLNLAGMSTATTGTGTITLGSALTGHLSFASAGAVNGRTYSYAIKDGNAREVGYGVYTSSGTTLSRTLINSTTGSLLSLSGSGVEVYIADLADDHLPYDADAAPGFADVVLLSDGSTAAWGRGEKVARAMPGLSEYAGNTTHNSGGGGVVMDFGADGPGWCIKVVNANDRSSYKTAGYDDAVGSRCKTLIAKSCLEGILRVPVIPDATNDFTIRFGYTDEWAYGDEGSNGIGFLLSRAAYSGSNPGNLRAYTKAAGTTTSTDTAITLANDTAYVLRIALTSASSIKFYVNAALVATHTTNIPAFTTANIKPTFVLKKVAGSTARDASLSNMLWWKEI